MDARAQLIGLVEAILASPHNLVSARDRELLDQRHVPECVALAAALPPCDRLVDIGSGGGLPGLVIAICRPDLDVHLIESRRKKAHFLRDTAASLQIRATVHHCRVEDRPVAGDIITARAVAPLVRLLPLASNVARSRAELWAVKGQNWAQELAAVTDWAGFDLIGTPDEAQTHTIAHELATGVEVDPGALPVIVRLRRQG